MSEKMTKEERLYELVEAFKADSGEYKEIRTPKDTEGRRRLLRSLMNIRMPRRMADDVLAVQNAYLKECALEKGIVTWSDIPEIRNGLSVWQGDITRLNADARGQFLAF